ncbi:MAG TPA: hypothetical protein VM925_30260 [Labilithrix sp.]|nr:hypothetical protein [Labilithrix sp.]
MLTSLMGQHLGHALSLAAALVLGCARPVDGEGSSESTSDLVASSVVRGQERAASLQGKTAVYDSARCYSAVSYWHGMLGAPVDVSPRFVAEWMRSPLVSRVDAGDLLPGDVIAFGAPGQAGVPLEHVAVINAQGEVFQKAGSPSEFPFEKLPWHEFVAKYPEVDAAHVYRVNDSLDAFLRKKGESMKVARDLSTRLAELEADLGKYTVVDIAWEGGSDEWAQEFSAKNTAVRAEAESIQTEIQARLDAPDLATDVAWVWRLLLERAASIQTIPDPFE